MLRIGLGCINPFLVCGEFVSFAEKRSKSVTPPETAQLISGTPLRLTILNAKENSTGIYYPFVSERHSIWGKIGGKLVFIQLNRTGMCHIQLTLNVLRARKCDTL